MRWQQIHLIAAAEATRAQRDLNLDPTSRIDPFGALVAEGVAVVRRPLEGLAGVYIAAEGRASGPPGVIVNSKHPLSKQRYTAAHELGHHRRDGLSILDVETEWVNQGTAPLTDRERLAEAFAAWFLMPARLVRSRLQDMHLQAKEIQPEQAYELALNLGTSYRATVNHLGDLRLLVPAHRDALVKASPRAIKIALLGGPPPGDLRRDVRRVSAGGDRAVGVQGDLVVIELPEIPSSGYRWTLSAVPAGVSLLDDRFERRNPRLALGSGGVRRFVVRLDEPVAATVHLLLRQPWTGGLKAETRNVSVEAEPRPRPGIVSPELVLAARV
jgi:predicted secreted protein